MFKNASHASSFKIIVSCYKPSRSILNFFELTLKAYTRGIPNRTTIFQDWAHQSFICRLFYLLWTRVKISSQEAKGPISLSANIADMCIPSQIICDSDPSNILKDMNPIFMQFASKCAVFQILLDTIHLYVCVPFALKHTKKSWDTVNHPYSWGLELLTSSDTKAANQDI